MAPDAGPGSAPLRVYIAPGEAADLQEMLDGDGVEFVEIGHIDELRVVTDPGVLFLSRGLLGAGGALESLSLLPAHIVVVAADDGGRSAATQAGRLFLAAPELAPGEAPLRRALRSAGAHAELAAASAAMRGSASTARRRLADVTRIGAALMVERDPDALLGMILTHARQLTGSDAGRLYLVEERHAGDGDDALEPRLRLLCAQNDSIPGPPDPDLTLPLSRDSIVGYAAATGEMLIIDDVHDLPATAPYSFDSAFDEAEGDRPRSMLVAPMIDPRSRVVGVLQLMGGTRTREEDGRDL